MTEVENEFHEKHKERTLSGRRKKSKMVGVGLAVMILAAATYWSGGCADGWFYQPDKIQYGTPADEGLSYEEVTFSSGDGTSLTGWFIPTSAPQQYGTVLQFHGNAQNMSAHYLLVSWLTQAGFNVFVFDYRGYGLSGGKASRPGVYEDCLAALRYLESRKDIAQQKILIVGQSLGGANAVAIWQTARFERVAGVVIDSAFSAYQAVAKDRAGILSLLVRWVVSQGYEPLAAVEKISPIPLVFIHGTNDNVVAYYHSKRLFEKAGEPKEFWTIEDGRHLEALDRPEIRTRLVLRLREWIK